MKTAHDLVRRAQAQIIEIDIGDAESEIRNADLLLDVREQEEFQAGHLPGAINIPRGLLEFQLSHMAELEARHLRIVVYCKTSGRAALSALTLQEMGYLHVRSLSGGFDNWEATGKAVVRPQPPNFL